MSDMIKRYEESKKPRLQDAKQIPNLATNYFDPHSKFAEGFTTFQKKGEPTKFSALAQKYFDTEYKEITLPDGYTPVEQGVNAHRWVPGKGYYVPGSKPGMR